MIASQWLCTTSIHQGWKDVWHCWLQPWSLPDILTFIAHSNGISKLVIKDVRMSHTFNLSPVYFLTSWIHCSESVSRKMADPDHLRTQYGGDYHHVFIADFFPASITTSLLCQGLAEHQCMRGWKMHSWDRSAAIISSCRVKLWHWICCFWPTQTASVAFGDQTLERRILPTE